MKKRLHNLREIFWPLLDELIEKEFKLIKVEEITVEDDNVKTAYDLALKYYENEDKRKSSIESKSTIFIGTIGFTVTIFLGLTKDILLNPNIIPDKYVCTSVLFLIAIILYLCRAVWFAIKVLERGSYSSISYNDFINSDSNYLRKLTATLINKARQNFKTINLKVDYMVMAQEYFKRAIFTIALFSIFIGVNILAKNKGFSLIATLSKVSINTWLIVVIFILFLIIFIMMIIFWKKLKATENNGKS